MNYHTSPGIVLVNPPSNCVADDRVEPPLGLLYIASHLRESGYPKVSLYDMSGCKSPLEIRTKMEMLPTGDIYGIMSFCTTYPYAKEIIRYVRTRDGNPYIAIGGPHPTGTPDYTLQDSGADVVVTGEGEDAFAECIDAFVAGMPLTGIQNGRGRNCIDDYPFPARDLVDMNTYSRKLVGQPLVSLLSSRGCKHHCIHCNSVVMGGGNRNVRYRSSSNILQEIRGLRRTYSSYRFNDDHFTGNPQLEDLLIGMKDLDISFRVFARLEDLNEQTSKLLREAGCLHVSIGLESLHDANLKVIGKGSQISHEDNVQVAKLQGLVVRASFMVGLPYDTDETIETAFTKAAQLGIDEFAVYPLIPYPGTLIAKFPERFGYTIINLNSNDYIQMGKNGLTCFALQHKNFGPQDVERWMNIATEILCAGGARHMRESKVAT